MGRSRWAACSPSSRSVRIWHATTTATRHRTDIRPERWPTRGPEPVSIRTGLRPRAPPRSHQRADAQPEYAKSKSASANPDRTHTTEIQRRDLMHRLLALAACALLAGPAPAHNDKPHSIGPNLD